jgi:tetratricopeptide (TPR) repeat protein
MKRAAPSAELYLIAARAYVGAGDTLRAEELLRMAIEREPARIAAYAMLAKLYVKDKLLDDAEEKLRELLKHDPKSIPINTTLGMLYETKHDLPAAEQQYQKTLSFESECQRGGEQPGMALRGRPIATWRLPCNWRRPRMQTLPEDRRSTTRWAGRISARACTRRPCNVWRSAPATTRTIRASTTTWAWRTCATKTRRAGKRRSSTPSRSGQTFDGADEARKTLTGLGKEVGAGTRGE